MVTGATCTSSSQNDYGSIPQHRPPDSAQPEQSQVKGHHMSNQDLYQRQPLLPVTSNGNTSWEDNDEAVTTYTPYKNGGLDERNGVVKINLPPPSREEPRFPKEKLKTLIAFFFTVCNVFLTTTSLAIIHEKVPRVPPLPDVILDLIPSQDWALDACEILIYISTNVCILVVLLHKHRFIILRRVFLIVGLLYLGRAITMFVTVLPVASPTYYCSPKLNRTGFFVITGRVLRLMSGFGLSINGQHTYCGDYIYSGHTAMLVIGYLVIREYTPRKCFLLHWSSFCVSFTGVTMLLISRGHYTVDIIIAYYITTRLFWIYHTMANNQQLKQYGPNNFISRVWWFGLFRYFEKNVTGIVPRQYEWPLPCPRRLTRKPPDRDS